MKCVAAEGSLEEFYNDKHKRDTPNTRKIVEGTRCPFYTIGKLSLPVADTLTRQQQDNNLNPKAQHCFCTMV